MKKKKLFELYRSYVMPTYTKMPYVFVKGKGMKIIDIDGQKYLDFFPGWGVGNVGHCHPAVISGVRDQVGKLIHLPNNFFHPTQARLAAEIIRTSFLGKVFFANSGAEANEAAIKLARAYGASLPDGPKYEIVTFENAFHGRTLATITATGQKKYQQGFEPLVEGFRTNVKFNDFDALQMAVTAKTVAVMIEVVQGEGGIHVAEREFLKKVRSLCDERKMLLIVDEVQTGMGRTGQMFGFQNYDIVPDVMTLAKSLGGGLPIGCMVARSAFADVLRPGMHASTFGGSPIVCKAALGVFRAIQKDKMLRNVKQMSAYIFSKLEKLKKKHSFIKEIRGLGLMIGIDLTIPGQRFVEACAAERLLINCTHETVLRFMPALNVTKRQVDQALRILDKVFSKVTP